jgi:hypothetical protein
MKNKLFLVGMFGVMLAFGLVFMACDTGTSNQTNGGGYGSLYAGRADSSSSSHAVMSQSVRNVALALAEEDFGDFPLDDFSIRIDYLVGRSTKTGYTGWGILNHSDENSEHVIPIMSNIKVRDLSSLTADGDNDFCDLVGCDIFLLYEGNSIANFPESMFIKGEELAFYQNPKTGGELREGWKDYKIISEKYLQVSELAGRDDVVVLPFDGIDLNRNFDLKFEWDISILVDALKDAKDNGGNYSAVENRSLPYIQDFFKSFDLKVIYK